MDIVTDLSSQAVTFITVYQGVLRADIGELEQKDTTFSDFFELSEKFDPLTKPLNKFQKKRITEIVFSSDASETLLDDDKKLSDATTCFLNTCKRILRWIKDFKKNDYEIQLYTLFSSAYEWRICVRKILYDNPDSRLELVSILEYMPVQIVLCLGGKVLDYPVQRLAQVWDPDCKLNQLSEKDQIFVRDWWKWPWEEDKGPKEPGCTFKEITQVNQPEKSVSRREKAKTLLGKDREILNLLVSHEIPLPFESIFNSELDEIEASREKRKQINADQDLLSTLYSSSADEIIKDRSVKKENCTPDLSETLKSEATTEIREKLNARKAGYHKNLWDEKKDGTNINDPLRRAQDMNLYALTFSGGGIRSATFNLGILQKLAGLGVLSRFDYISTVSGGGYIGSWLASWIKRSGSVKRVMNRLDPKLSMDPLADELRPIRWLRMFSNYLSPNASIMSGDAWTLGITWLRNTIINQIILLLLLCSALSFIGGIYGIWCLMLDGVKLHGQIWMTIASVLALIPGALLAGRGMRTFNPKYRNKSPGWFDRNLYNLLIGWGALCTFFLSAWFYGAAFINTTFLCKADILAGTAIGGFIGFVWVAYYGKYNECVPVAKKKEVWTWIILSSIVAVACGVLLLSLCWVVFERIICICIDIHDFNHRLAFIIGAPLILETISIIVVVRMSLMGILFPDLRREWWGRMGALVHRFSFIWILVAFCALLLPDIMIKLFDNEHFWTRVPVLFGGWGAIVGYAVKLAYNANTSGQKPASGGSSMTELFVTFAPYIFAVGFLFISAITLHKIENWVIPAANTGQDMWKGLLVTVGLGLLTFILSYRVGVNEFSLHHFYRNRLTRAYLGATKRREERERTENDFTKFDEEDDLPLASLCTTEKYYGPYPVINVTLNSTVVTDLDRQDRKGESFVFTSQYCGYDVCRTRPSANSLDNNYEYGYRPTAQYAYPETGGPTLGTAMTISGAAVSPNQGYHSSPATAFLLTLFNVRLGWWMGNPKGDSWKQSDPWLGISYLLYDLAGNSDITKDFVCLSDGGHFDNMGLYEMVRRRCKFIMICDAEEDQLSTCEGLANAIRRCRIDFGAEVDLKIDPIITKDAKTGYATLHWVDGSIWYPGDGNKPSGTIVYVKTALTGSESVDIREYFMNNPAFPQQSTGDQFFDESQFESYRKLGYSSI